MYELTDVNVMSRHQKGQIKRLQLYISIKAPRNSLKKVNLAIKSVKIWL
jgi:hypothetical protein